MDEILINLFDLECICLLIIKRIGELNESVFFYTSYLESHRSSFLSDRGMVH